MNRSKAFLKALAENGHSAALLTKPENMRYISGYTGEGYLLVCDKACVIITDSRYTEQAGRQSPECRVFLHDRQNPITAILTELCNTYSIHELCAETDFLSYDAVMAFKNELKGVSVVPLDAIPEKLRAIKDEVEIDCILRACDISCKAFDHLLKRIKPGMTEKQIQILLDYEMLQLGSEKNAFDTIAAAGINGSLPHAIPSDYVVHEGDLLTLDFGALYGGYCADMTRTIAFGKVRKELRDLYDAVFTAQQMALDAIRPGMDCKEVDRVARDYLDNLYPKAFGHSLGHSLGLEIHERPGFSPRETAILQPGMAITVEPGVYIPGVGGCRIEDTVIITADGYVNAVTAPKQLIEL